MSDTFNAWDIPNLWTDFNALSGYPVGSELLVQNVGRPADIIECALSPTQPSELFRGHAFDQIKKQYRITPDDNIQILWVKFTRIDQNDTYSIKGKLQAQAAYTANIIEADVTPADIYSSEDPASRRIKTIITTREETQMSQGTFYVGASERVAVPIDDINNTVIVAAVDKYVILESAVIQSDFSNIDEGHYSIRIDGYVQGSNGNSWSYTPINPLSIGRPLNAGKINDLPTSTIDLGITVPVLIGFADYPMYFEDYYIDTAGNRQNISSTGTNFFEQNRQIIIPPGHEILIRTITGGTSLGSSDFKTIFFMSEIYASDWPYKD